MKWLFLFLSVSLWALPFGKNKVQYEQSAWKQIQTPHFDIYYAQRSLAIATYAADHVENIYESIATKLDHKLTQRIPIIIHRSHAHFQETNVIPQALPEAIGGFTTVFQNRIVLPFDGSYPHFHHVLHHELVHAMMFNYFQGGGSGGVALARKMAHIPLWFSEGMAEYLSLDGWNLESEFYMIDAISFGYATPPTVNYGGFMAYRGGQNFLFYLEETFGKGSIQKLLQEMKKGYDVDEATLRICGVSLEELGELWLRELRRLYWPELGNRRHGKEVALQLTHRQKDGNFLNVNPKISPDGAWIVYFSDYGDWEGLYLYDVTKKEVVKRLLKSGSSSGHESLHPFHSSVTWNANSEQIAFVSKLHNQDVLYIQDIHSKKAERIEGLAMDMISSPDWSKDGTKLVFSGTVSGQQDLYLWDLEQKKLTQLTFDKASQDKPSFSPQGDRLIFQSDLLFQREKGRSDKSDLFVLHLPSMLLDTLESDFWDKHNPTWMDSNKVAYTSNRSGIQNIYVYDFVTQKEYALSNILSSSFSPSFTAKADFMAFSVFEAGGWELFLMENPWDKKQDAVLPSTHFVHWKKNGGSYWKKLALGNLTSYDTAQLHKDSIIPSDDKDSLDEFSLHYGVDTTKVFSNDSSLFKKGSEYVSKPYETEWHLDRAVAAAGLATNGAQVAVGGQAFLTFTDLMGDQQLDVMLYSSGTSFRDINAYTSYGYLAKQWDFSFRGSHLSYELQERSVVDTSNQLVHGELYSDSVSVEKARTASGEIVNACRLYFGKEDELTLLKNGQCETYSVFHDRLVGGGVSARYPFSLFSRIDFAVDYTRISRTLQKEEDGTSSYEDNPEIKTRSLHKVELASNWAFDNTRWGVVGPVNGGRYALGAKLMPKIETSTNDLGYYLLEADFRKYFQFFKKYTLAFRSTGGVSYALPDAENPHSFLVGGDNFTLNYNRNRENLQNTLKQRYFSTIETPLRGFYYYDFVGNHKWINSVELRFPFIQQLTLGWPPITFTHIMGNLFADYGGAWQSGSSAWDTMGLGFGWGLRMNLGIFVLRYTRAWDNDDLGNVHHGEVNYWSLGAEF